VGASGWHERVAWVGDLAATLTAAQEQVLERGDFIWPWDSFDPDDEIEPADRPTTLAALAAAKAIEEFWDEGTHSILDVDHVAAAGADEFGAISPLTEAQAVAATGSATPDRSAVEALVGPGGPGEALQAFDGQKWSGRALVIHDAATPVEVVFWGWSGD
jgi:hypothetical protein